MWLGTRPESSVNAYRCVAGDVRPRVHRRPPGQHSGHLCGDPLLKNADRDQYVHREPRRSRRVFPHRHPLPVRHHVPGVLAVR